MTYRFRLQINATPGLTLISFTLKREENPNLRNRIRRILERYDMRDAGTTLFEGSQTPHALENLVDEIFEVVEQDTTSAVLTNLAVWFMGTQRYNYSPQEESV